jgi:hypothetical protein
VVIDPVIWCPCVHGSKIKSSTPTVWNVVGAERTSIHHIYRHILIIILQLFFRVLM